MDKVYVVLQKCLSVVNFFCHVLSVPIKREGLEVVQLCAVIIGRPVSLSRFEGEAVLFSLWTFGRSSM